MQIKQRVHLPMKLVLVMMKLFLKTTEGYLSQIALKNMQLMVNYTLLLLYFLTALVHVPNFGGLSGSEDRGGGDNSIQFINFGRVGDKSFK